MLNGKYIVNLNLKENLRNKTGKGLVNKALQYMPVMHLSLPIAIYRQKKSPMEVSITQEHTHFVDLELKYKNE